jgi:peroxiredoxin
MRRRIAFAHSSKFRTFKFSTDNAHVQPYSLVHFVTLFIVPFNNLQLKPRTDKVTISIGDTLPNATLLEMGDNGPINHTISALTENKTVVIFGLPGAFTPTCSSAHMPSFVRNAERLRDKGIDDIICVSVNDPHVMRVWSKDQGADTAGVKTLADADGSFTRAIGMEFSAPPTGLLGRSKRYSMIVTNGIVTSFNPEIERGVCDLSGAETILDQL